MSTNRPFILDANAETFGPEVVERSRDTLVLVDFWAEWCGPCRMLGPVLEKLADEYAGKFLLVKADTERVPEIAGSFGVRSIPAVFALRDGQVVDGFVGVQPEAVIRQFIDRLLPTPAEQKVAEGRRLEPIDPAGAEAAYRAALGLDDRLAPARIGLARVRLERGDPDEAGRLLAELERRGFLEPEAESIKARLTLGQQAEQAGDLSAARAAVAADPANHGARLRLAEALAAAGEYPEALEMCLDLVERDRKRTGEEARKTMLAVFQLLPADSELVGEYRRRLSLVL